MRPPDPPLRHGELTLRPWCLSDLGALVATCGDPEIVRWTPVPTPYTDTDATEDVARSDALWSDGSGAAFAIAGTALRFVKPSYYY